jgi:hypothetical protein
VVYEKEGETGATSLLGLPCTEAPHPVVIITVEQLAVSTLRKSNLFLICGLKGLDKPEKSAECPT